MWLWAPDALTIPAAMFHYLTPGEGHGQAGAGRHAEDMQDLNDAIGEWSWELTVS